MRKFFSPAIVCVLTVFAGAAHAQTAPATAPAATTATVLQTFSKVVVDGNKRGPNRIGNETGAGIINPAVDYKVLSDGVLVLMTYTRSAQTANNNDSYMQGGATLAKITEKGVEVGTPLDFPQLNGDRPCQRAISLIADDGMSMMAICASEDNGVNNNPQPVAYVLKRSSAASLDLAITQIPNSTRGANNINKPTNLIQQAIKDGINVPNANNQRGPHTFVQTGPNTWAIGMQYNNQAFEAFSVTLNADASIKMNWLERYSNNSQHVRPSVALDKATNTLWAAGVEGNTQPLSAFRLVAIDPATGKAKPGMNKVVVKTDPNANKYLATPALQIVGGIPTAVWTMTSKARANNNNGNGHAGGGGIVAAAQFDPKTLAMIGSPMIDVGPYSRHPGAFATNYGPNGTPALVVMGASSTGEAPGKQQLIPLGADSRLGVKDLGKMYTVSQFSDVANLSSRGNNNTNNQARGFINGIGDVPNPGFGKADGFMPEVKTFTMSAVPGYSDVTAKGVGLKLSLWLSLVPATWKEGIATVPGTPTDKPGANADGTGPQPTISTTTPTSTDPGTVSDPTNSGVGSSDNNVSGDESAAQQAGGSPAYGRASSDAGGCSVSSTSTSSSTGFAGSALLVLGVAALIRRRRNEEV